MKEMEVRLERLNKLRAAYSYSDGSFPEEEAFKKIMSWAERKGLLSKEGVRFFGRNTYPNDKVEGHGYECFLTIENQTVYNDIEISEIPSGLYAVLRFKDIRNISFAWNKLWTWIEEKGYEYAGWLKGKHGWVSGFEEQVNWQENATPTKWIYDLWLPLEE